MALAPFKADFAGPGEYPLAAVPLAAAFCPIESWAARPPSVATLPLVAVPPAEAPAGKPTLRVHELDLLELPKPFSLRRRLCFQSLFWQHLSLWLFGPTRPSALLRTLGTARGPLHTL